MCRAQKLSFTWRNSSIWYISSYAQPHLLLPKGPRRNKCIPCNSSLGKVCATMLSDSIGWLVFRVLQLILVMMEDPGTACYCGCFCWAKRDRHNVLTAVRPAVSDLSILTLCCYCTVNCTKLLSLLCGEVNVIGWWQYFSNIQYILFFKCTVCQDENVRNTLTCTLAPDKHS